VGPPWTTRTSPFAAEDDFQWESAEFARCYFAFYARRPLTMGLFYNIMLGYFFGFALGVGSALAVFYAIYSGGYRKAVEHSLAQPKPKRYLDAMATALRTREKEKTARPNGEAS
jgi:hypothetical protein